MRLLAVNTASARLSIALVEGDGQAGVARVLAQADIAEPRDQGNFLLHTITAAVRDNGLTFADLDQMVAVTGPGSFTGIRIGLAAMRGFALASGVSLGGINSFDLYAGVDGLTTPHRLVVIESWREELYFRLDDQPAFNVTPVDCAGMLAEQGIATTDITLLGDATERAVAALAGARVHHVVPTAVDVAQLALLQPQLCADASPFYLREADVSFGRANRILQKEGSA